MLESQISYGKIMPIAMAICMMKTSVYIALGNFTFLSKMMLLINIPLV